ncbi:metal dependent phosphohydrolase [Stanieria cyanosphaera PCC 7437]|uniref:bis(5'-nucleosyl)-tetraphosphatase (symmetrical) n=1 Tax=Stanieria cyanosphaera (strain ATCC 29371 / PCC 7437) TaxID=111780 RepID=K9XWZ8_STAC7|nr:bis(5'-nucleosyl)-tetraphosphatase (symmetrical) YqeK [Stanieria cyanosphaera]AFZ36584.1 metal dependent phosphohydrolase [Stanieria cyanosphaera PCC 7437]
MRERVLAWLADHVSAERIEHILGVEQTCLELARLHQVNEQEAALAGLMHDLAKFFPPDKLLSLAQQHGVETDEILTNSPHLLHAEVGAIVAQREFGIENPEILAAIRHHTLGFPGMSPLSCVVFVADAIEPLRGNTPELEVIRLTARENLYKAVRQTCDYSLRYLVSRIKIIHPRVILTRNWALIQEKQFLETK